MVDTTASGELVGTSTGAIANTRDVSPTPEELSVHDDVPLHDHVGLALDSSAPMVAFNARCQAALKETIWRERRGVVWPHLYADALGGVQLGARARADDPRIVYFIGLTRKSAAIMVSRLLLALYHHSHLFLVHLDLKADSAVVSELAALIKDHPNIHLMQTRRLVQWGAWTMNLILLDALHSAVSASIDFDFVINLSDVDVALRTNDEIVSFLRQYKGRQFVQVHQGSGEWLDKAKNFTANHNVIECGGYGFVAVNSTPLDLGSGPQMAFGRGGPVVYANTSAVQLSEVRQAVKEDAAHSRWAARRKAAAETAAAQAEAAQAEATMEEAEAKAAKAEVAKAEAATSADAEDVDEADEETPRRTALHTGSQWMILSRGFATYLVRDERAARWMRVFERRFLSDEAFVQTVLMHSPYNGSLVNHNMRYIYWPHYDGDPQEYWARMGVDYVGGPQVINSSALPGVLRSPYMFARKVDPTVDADTVRLWDEWMAKKLRGAAPGDQDVLGGMPAPAARIRAEDTLERLSGSSSGETDFEDASATPLPPLGAVMAGDAAVPRAYRPPLRSVARILFEDGSSCECSPACEATASCCDDWPEVCQMGRGTGGADDTDDDIEGEDTSGEDTGSSLPPCPVPIHPASSPGNGTRIRLSFVNHARYPVRLYHQTVGSTGGAMGATGREVGALQPRGPPLTFDTVDVHAWTVKTWAGVTLLELPARIGRLSGTVDIHECARNPVRRALHQGWR